MGDMPWNIYPRAKLSMRVLMRHDGFYQFGNPDEAAQFVIETVPSEVTVAINPHTQANTCEAKIDLSALPFDPRQLEGLFLVAAMGCVKSARDDVGERKYQRFVGYIDKASREFAGSTSVKLEARDLSSPFRDAKVIPTAALPLYTDTIMSGMQRLIDSLGMTDVVKIVDQTGRANDTLSSLVGKRGQRGHLPIKPDASYWGAMEHIAGVANLIVDVELGEISLRSPADAFALDVDGRPKASYTFTYGDEKANTLKAGDSKNFIRNRKGILVTGFDPKTRRLVTGKYPSDHDLLARKRPKTLGVHHAKHPKKKPARPSKDPDRDVISVGTLGIANQQVLDGIAERFYRERAYQEMEGSLETVNWDDKDITGNAIDIFDLRMGKRIKVAIRPDLAAELKNLRGDREKAIAYLKSRLNIDEQPARVLIDYGMHDSEVFACRSLKHHWTAKSARTTIDYITIVEV